MTLAIKSSPGYSLVEFLVAMLILALVSLSWLTIAQVQSANRESYRREAVERLAGMMDVISRYGNLQDIYKDGTAWKFDEQQGMMSADSTEVIRFRGSTIGYRLRIKKLSDVVELGFVSAESCCDSEDLSEKMCLDATAPVLVGELFEGEGMLDREDYADNDDARTTNAGNRFWRAAVVLRWRGKERVK